MISFQLMLIIETDTDRISSHYKCLSLKICSSPVAIAHMREGKAKMW